MFKIFRNKRQEQISKNKPGKYLKYALGEIILVVIGILIALQINKWNDNQKNLKEANNFITELKGDLRTDTLIFGQEIKKIDQLIEYKKWGLSNENFIDIPVSELEGLFLSQYHNLKIKNNTYERIKNSEVFYLIKYEELFKEINSYYTFYQEYLNNFNAWEVEMFNKDFNFWFEQNNFEIGFGLDQIDSIAIKQNKKIRKTAIINTINSIQGRNHLKMNLLREQVMRSTYQMVYDKAIEILIKIDDTANKQGR